MKTLNLVIVLRYIKAGVEFGGIETSLCNTMLELV